ncbi:MAG: hydantoinase/oxoprolinase family protein [Candidatus Thorarchaeota archaeon]
MGLDIGGANTKAALLNFKDEKIRESFSFIEYFPFWEKTIKEIPEMLKRVVKHLLDNNDYKLEDVEYFAVTITAELSDAFQTKREGIHTILNALKTVFNVDKLKFITKNCEFVNYNKAKSDYSSIAAANWASTALYLGKYIPQCILIDAGSTTIDIIPILDSIPVPQGKDDVSRLINHELIYTGGLRATIPSITHHVPYKNRKVRVSFEKFALISDIHRILNNISEDEYINDTADNRSKSLENCYARLARIICMDKETISTEHLDIIANFIYQKQLNLIKREIKAFMNSLISNYKEFMHNPKFVITGLSADFLIRKTLQDLGFKDIYRYETITRIPNNISSSAFAIAGALNNQILNHQVEK